MMEKRVIFLSYNYFESSHFSGSQQYALCFESIGWKVLYFSDWISLGHFLRFRNYSQKMQKIDLWFTGGKQYRSENIKYYNPFSLFYLARLPVLRHPGMIFLMNTLSFPTPIQVINKHGFDRADLVWVENPTYYYVLKKLKRKGIKVVYRISDDVAGLSGHIDNVIWSHEHLLKLADFVCTPSLVQKENLESRGIKIYYLPNGFRPTESNSSDCPLADLTNVPHPRIIYVGAIARWFDLTLLEYCLKELKFCSFVIIGNKDLSLSKYKRYSNFYYLGPKKQDEVNSYLMKADIGIIPFRLDVDLVHSVNPIKMYEYMSAGLPIVAAAWQELKLMNPPIKLASSKEEFVAHLRVLIDNPTKRNYEAYIKEATWMQRLKRFLEIIDK